MLSRIQGGQPLFYDGRYGGRGCGFPQWRPLCLGAVLAKRFSSAGQACYAALIRELHCRFCAGQLC